MVQFSMRTLAMLTGLFGVIIAFFFIVGWWALLASPFMLVAAALAFKYSRRRPEMVT